MYGSSGALGRPFKQEVTMPAIWKDTVKAIRKSSPDVNEYAVATSALQKAGELKPGTREATKLGVKRGKMTRKQRHSQPLADGGAVKPSLGRIGRHG
jgi:hypothetical protein